MSANSDTCQHCGRTVYEGEWPYCPHGYGRGGNRITAYHSSEKAVVYRNSRTGQYHGSPASADMPIPAQYIRDGIERVTIDSPQQMREYEKSTGKLHERTHYDPGSGRMDRELEAHIGGNEVAEKTAILDQAYSEA